MSVNRQDLEVVTKAVREVLEAEGYSRWVSDEKIERLSTYVLEKLEYDRMNRQ